MSDTPDTVTPNGNGATARRDHILGYILGCAILGEILLSCLSFWGSPADWTTVNQTRNDLAELIKLLAVGYFAARSAGK